MARHISLEAYGMVKLSMMEQNDGAVWSSGCGEAPLRPARGNSPVRTAAQRSPPVSARRRPCVA